MSTLDLSSVFEALSDPAARTATAPMLALALGVMLYLLCDIVDALRSARPLAFVGSLAVALLFEVRLLLRDASELPGPVLEGTLIADHGTAMWGVLFLLATFFSWIYAQGYYSKENRPFTPEHDLLLLSAPVGMMLMIGAGDLIVFFIGLELLSIPLYALAAFRRARLDSVEAGLKYFLLGAFSSALFLYGAALVYSGSGTLSLAGIQAAGSTSTLSVTGLALIFSSLLFKVSAFPFHLWVPDVYQGAPTPVTILMATGTKAAAFGFLIVRLTPLLPAEGAGVVTFVALATMALGNLGALVQEDFKRMLAYSGISHAGTLLLLVVAGMAGGDADSIQQAALFYMGAYLFTACGAFGLVSLLESDGGQYTRFENLRGLAHSRPGMAAALSLFMLSLGGIPATGGFLGKWFVFSELVRADKVGVAILGALLSVIALAYYLKVLITMYMQPAPPEVAPPTAQRPLSAGLATAICVAGVLAMGLVPSLFLSL